MREAAICAPIYFLGSLQYFADVRRAHEPIPVSVASHAAETRIAPERTPVGRPSSGAVNAQTEASS